MLNKKINDMLASISPWHYIWITILLSELLTLIIDSIVSYLLWGHISKDLLIIGTIPAFIVPLAVAPLIIFFVLQISKMKEELLQKQIEQERLQAQRLESLGLLAGGIAHDFNNALTGILANISYLKMHIAQDDTLYLRVEKAQEASIRAKALARQLLTFSPGGVPIKKAMDVKTILIENIERALKGTGIIGVFHIDADLWPVEGDTGQLGQVFNNLALNAVETMPDGGAIDVAARNVWIGEKENLPLKKGNHIIITITDRGEGISDQDLLKVFDPYFTTKEGRSGLGLTAAYSIIRGHDGCIKIVSERETGTTVSVYLPASLKEVFKNGIMEQAYKRGSGKVLLMDDQKLVRESGAEMLKETGYYVETARDGNEVIALYRRAMESGKPFDAVIMDLTVTGGMGGSEAIKVLLQIDPQVNAIISSGYSNDSVMANYLDYGFRGMLEKPYMIQELVRVLEDVMTGGKKDSGLQNRL